MASGNDSARLIERDGLVYSVSPATPNRSLPNSVYYSDREALEAALEELPSVYEGAGVRAWTVWVPDDDRETAALLGRRGHVLDANPRAMALWLDDLREGPPRPEGVELRDDEQATAGALNDLAYGVDGHPFTALLANPTTPPIHWAFAASGGDAVGCAGTVDDGDDAIVTLVATHPDHRGRGLAGWLLREMLLEASERGQASASLQATKLGAGVYERLGFRDLGYIEMWERRPESGPA